MKNKYLITFTNLEGNPTAWELKTFKEKEDLVKYLVSIGIKFEVYLYFENERDCKKFIKKTTQQVGS